MPGAHPRLKEILCPSPPPPGKESLELEPLASKEWSWRLENKSKTLRNSQNLLSTSLLHRSIFKVQERGIRCCHGKSKFTNLSFFQDFTQIEKFTTGPSALAGEWNFHLGDTWQKKFQKGHINFQGKFQEGYQFWKQYHIRLITLNTQMINWKNLTSMKFLPNFH